MNEISSVDFFNTFAVHSFGFSALKVDPLKLAAPPFKQPTNVLE